MSSDVATVATPATQTAPPKGDRPRRAGKRAASAHTTLTAHGEPLVWLTGGALAVALAMIVGLLGWIVYVGSRTFWPVPVVQVDLLNGRSYLGEVSRQEMFQPEDRVFTQIEKAVSPEAGQQARAYVEERDGLSQRRLFRTGNFDLTGTHFNWVEEYLVKDGSEAQPEWALVVERMAGGIFYGTPAAFLIDGEVVASTPEEVWAKFQEFHGPVCERREEVLGLDKDDRGDIDRQVEDARIDTFAVALDYGDGSDEHKAAEQAFVNITEWGNAEKAKLAEQIGELNAENARYAVRMDVVGSGPATADIKVADIVRAFPANQLGLSEKFGVYFSRWWEFLADDPREANSEGGVFPAIWGTIAMTLIMSMLAVPFGVLAALHLREYAKRGPLVSAIRISINNLAGVPSIVFGVFGIGFFCYGVGRFIDLGPSSPWPKPTWYLGLAAVAVVGAVAFFFSLDLPGQKPAPGAPQKLRIPSWALSVLWISCTALAVLLIAKSPFFEGFFRPRYVANNDPTFGKGGLLWASLTLALLTLPVVIVATEEALSAVPNSMREGSYACGASKWQTIRRIVLPRAMPGIMTGMILAMARGAGEVAPLMLVGVKPNATSLPVDMTAPYVHLERSFMHLGYHIFDVGFHSQNSEAAKPMVFTTTLLLISIIAFLNIAAISLRTRLRRKFVSAQF